MSPRSIRRAAERQALKLTRKAETRVESTPASATADTPAHALLSEARLAANRANAQLSTGPTSEAGKRISSLNAVKSALTGQTVLLPTDDIAAYEQTIAKFVDQHQPETREERELVQQLADTQWRLNRIVTLEFALFARGRHEFADQFASHEPALASALIDAETLVAYGKQIKNLHTQEGRLRRYQQQTSIELAKLQDERRQAETEEAQTPAREISSARAAAGNGFVFSNALDAASETPAIGLNPQPWNPERAQAVVSGQSI